MQFENFWQNRFFKKCQNSRIYKEKLFYEIKFGGR